MASSEGQACQSCGKPINRSDDFGTNADGSKSSDYCNYCFKSGNFTYPNITMEQMIEIAASLMVTLTSMSENESKEKAKTSIPKLKRWNK